MSAATPEANRATGYRRLYAFIGNAGPRYSKSRNFDFGPGRRSNVSLLSPYVRHRLLSEQEILDATLRQHSLTSASKFVQEVFWRAYFKGWIEHHPAVWGDYRSAVSQQIRSLESDAKLLDHYDTAIEGNTGIDCFDAWVTELVETGYLHNHARMWFASIWIYTLQLPWQLGADFFYRHLIDGDPASNTLSWRWVCGLHTRGKTYLARVSNIANYTDNRFRPDGQLATSAPPLTETRVFPPEPLPPAQALPVGDRYGLLITEEDCNPESLLGESTPVAALGVVATKMRSPLPIGEHAYRFAKDAVTDAVRRTTQGLGIDGVLQDADDWSAMLVDWATQHHINTIVTPYAPVGPVAERIAATRQTLDRYGIRVLQIRRPYDDACWPHAKRGYFKLKEQIPSLLERLGISHKPASPESKAG